MKVIIAPDKFKGTISAAKAAEAMANGVIEVHPDAKVIKCPLADGGEGTLEALVQAGRDSLMMMEVLDPLGRKIKACFGLINKKRRLAVIEMAKASGLYLLKPEERRPLIASTYGTGQLIKRALDYNPELMIIGIGGSATNDGGVGMARALGGKFLDSSKNEISSGAAGLMELDSIDLSGLDKRLEDVEIVVASDVKNPLLGADGAARTYGPQKGASPDQVIKIEIGLKNLSQIAIDELNLEPGIVKLPGVGAAGGLGFGLKEFLKARIKPGAELIISESNLTQKMDCSDMVITGEGMIDSQTIYGKTIEGVSKLASKKGIPVIVIAGQKEEGLDTGSLMIDWVFSLTEYFSLEESINKPAYCLERVTIEALKKINQRKD